VLKHEPDVPVVWADHDRLEQVFVNLLDNAVRHAAGVTQIAVTATFDRDDDNVTVRVVDDGCGIGQELIDRVFLPGEHGAGEDAGAGLGLAIARGIVDAHGGSIRIEAAQLGTTLAVTLPVDGSAGQSSVDEP
jgi:signal transduction histidine kinase